MSGRKFDEAPPTLKPAKFDEIVAKMRADMIVISDTRPQKLDEPAPAGNAAASGDAITAGASPRPWKIIDNHNGYLDVYAADGPRVTAWGVRTPRDAADIALIVEAVNAYGRRENWRKKYIDRRVEDAARLEEMRCDIADAEAERDRLRDLVRRLAETLGLAITVLGSYVAMYRCAPHEQQQNTTLCGVDITELLREARAAVGEDKRC